MKMTKMHAFSESENKIVLVTGRAVFIGAHLKKILDIGRYVHFADNFSRGRIENITIEKVSKL